MRLFSNSRTSEVDAMKAKVDPFGKRNDNPVRNVIAELRARRDEGLMSDADFAIEVAALLGASDLSGPGTAGL